MQQAELPEWESALIDEAITSAEQRLADESARAKRRAVQLAREQGYHRLAVAIDRPAQVKPNPDQLSFFPTDPTLFDAS
ncbi:MAG TPA: hypothetical protein VG408_04880 [Actinomycetota bacterium]|nr:hypothetical protein [Actinomycetota bacterium]